MSYYPSTEEYLAAISEAMKVEYDAIVAAGLTLQIDAPEPRHGATTSCTAIGVTTTSFHQVAVHVEALNHALRDISSDQVRLHLCWGNYEGPHHFDIELKKILAEVLRAKPSDDRLRGLEPRVTLTSGAVWQEASIPDDKVLAPGVIGSTNKLRRAPRAHRSKDCLFRRDRRSRARDCGDRLRVWHLGWVRSCRSRHLLGRSLHRCVKERRSLRRGRIGEANVGILGVQTVGIAGAVLRH